MARIPVRLPRDPNDFRAGNLFFDTDSNKLIIYSDATFQDIAEKLPEGWVNVKDFGAKGDGVTDDSAAFQAAIDAATNPSNTVYKDIGGFQYGVLFVPKGEYHVKNLTFSSRLKIVAHNALFYSSPKDSLTRGNKFISSTNAIYFEIEGGAFRGYDKVFDISSGNLDTTLYYISKTFARDNGIVLDTYSYAASRSSLVVIEKNKWVYNDKAAAIYTDMLAIRDNWFYHNYDGEMFTIDSLATIENNIITPVGTDAKPKKCAFIFQPSDPVRGLFFRKNRWTTEGCFGALVVVKGSTYSFSQHYKNMGISFDGDQLGLSGRIYDPDNTGTPISNIIVLQPKPTDTQFIDYISFKNVNFFPDKNVGIIGSYNISDTDLEAILPADFVIEFDEVSYNAAIQGVNTITLNPVIEQRVKLPLNFKQFRAVPDEVSGQQKFSFKVNISAPDYYLKPITFLMTLAGQYSPSYAYGVSSVYLVQIFGYYQGSTQIKIAATPLASQTGGVIGGNELKADIVSIYWNETGTDTLNWPPNSSLQEVTVVFGQNLTTNPYVTIVPLSGYNWFEPTANYLYT